MKPKKENYTFFNEEWNRQDWEDGVDEIDQRKENKKTTKED